MSERVSHPHPVTSPNQRTSTKTILLRLFLLALFCAATASASAGAEEQRHWGAAEAPSSLSDTSTIWSPVNELFRRLSGSGDDNDELVYGPEASNGAMFSESKVLQPFTDYIMRKREHNQDNSKNFRRSVYHGSLENSHRTLNRERKLSSKEDWGGARKSERQNGLVPLKQENWEQEGGKFEVSSADKSSKEAQNTGHESSITTVKRVGRNLARTVEREKHLTGGQKRDSSLNTGAKRKDTQSIAHDAVASLGVDTNSPSDNDKKNYFHASRNPSIVAYDTVRRDSSETERLARDGKHTEHATSALYISGSLRDGPTSTDNAGMYISSASPVAAPPWDSPWHSQSGTSSAVSPLVGGTHIFSESWGEGGRNTEYGEEMGWHEGVDEEPSWVRAAVDYHPLVLDQDRYQDVLEDPMEQVPPGPNEKSSCGCWDTDAVTPEKECSCWGHLITQVPLNLSRAVFRITLNEVGIETLRNDSFTRYRETLHEIVLENVPELRTIEAGAFKGLYQLRSIYIHSAPHLRTMPNFTVTVNDKNLRSLRVASSGLERIPDMQFTGPLDILNMIDLDNNRIRKVHSKSLKVRVEQLSLNYNLIESVEKEAFAGSEIGKLSLKGNTNLRSLSPEAFKGIGSLRTLDLSETSITSLPTLGLTDLEFLYLERTPSLKVFPSVYSFETIQEAHLTYPYHCCAFQFPEQHDPKQYVRHQEFIRKMEQEHCSELMSPTSSVMSPITRVRRHSRSATPISHPRESQSPVGSTLQESLPVARPNPGERWGSIALSATGSVFGLSVPSITGEHERYRQKERTQASLRNHSPQMTSYSSQPYRKKMLDGGSNSLPPGTVILPRTRHNCHQTRHVKPKLSPDSSHVARSSLKETQEPYRSRSRRGDHPELARPPDAEDEARRTFLPTPQQRSAAMIRDPEKELIPLPEKRFETDEKSPYPQDYEEGFVGGGAVGGYHSLFLGFGSFNHTSNRKNESSKGSWGHDQGWSGRSPALDTGDDKTYGGELAETPHFGDQIIRFPSEDDGLLHPGGGFPLDGGFPDDSENVHDHDSSVHGSGLSEWHHNQAPVNNNSTITFFCGNLSKDYHNVLCVPKPDAFNPCEDIMGNLALRVAVWLVVVTAVLGNLAVIIVLISSKFKRATLRKLEQTLDGRSYPRRLTPFYSSCNPSSRMTVSKFLMVNLALADLCMGLYLLIIAAMDLHTIGVYFNHAIDWQNGPGCKVAGFLTVFASELSIFTLTVITSERWYAITYAIHLNKRLKLSMAVKIMVVGWTYSITMAALPLLGISSYSKTSICLPMETGNALALSYLISLLLVNGLAFFVITACYASMYCSISRHDATAPHSDLTVAKRMALLVFTDFACWAPIAFFGLTAVAGVPLINVTRAKILLVFFYPLNSCANPYLYAILTKQYRRDLFILLARYGFCTKRAMRYKGAYSSVNNTFPHNTVVNAPNHRNSTLTQITLCDLTRNARASQQSNNGSLLGTMVGGSQDSLQRNVSPLRTPTKPDMASGENERLSTVQEMSHSTHSDEDPSDDHVVQHDDFVPPDDHDSPSGVVKQAGSPHPIKNCYTRLSFTPEQEEILKQALHESKAKKRNKPEVGRKSPVNQALLLDQNNSMTENRQSLGHNTAENLKSAPHHTTENGKSPGHGVVELEKSIANRMKENAKSPSREMTENGKSFVPSRAESGKSSGHGEVFVICEVEMNQVRDRKNVCRKGVLEEATSSV